MPWAQVKPVLDFSVRQLCREKYPGHPRGCPNYGRRGTCPPKAQLLPDILMLTDPVWIVWNAFDLAAHVARMRRKHPKWSDRQLYCCLYWQGAARKALRAEICDFQRSFNRLISQASTLVVRCPEACGVNVTATMALADIKLEWPPENIAYQVSLLGVPR